MSRSLATDTDVVELPETPGKNDVDPLLAERAQRLIVAGTDADLAAVVLRLLRKNRLATTQVGFVPAERHSRFARRWNLPTGTERALALARAGSTRSVPLIRDDAGGVLLGQGVIAPIRAVVYCDDQLALREPARSLEVVPSETQEAGLIARITATGPLRRRRSYTGRALQISFDPQAPARPSRDGLTRPRPVGRWTWYRHTEDLQLVRVSAGGR